MFGLICRCALSTLRETRQHDSTLPAAMEVFVDDPWVAMLGTERQCRRMTAVLVLAWRILGINLALKKGQLGDKVDWIGASLSIESDKSIALAIIKSRLDELAVLCTQLVRYNTVSAKSVRSFAGKCQSMASVLYTWRPFVYTLYGALSKPPLHLPEGLLYTKQISQAVAWISTFLNGKKGDLVRVMHVDAHYRRGVKVDIIVDACPRGMGGVLSLDGLPQEYFSIPTTAADAHRLGMELTTDSKCQQAFEALAMLIALRHWYYQWSHRRSVIHVHGDNMSALSMVTRMQPHSYSLGVVAWELALDISDAVYEPQVASHVPGVANVAADCLSRRFEPGKTFTLPPVLAKCTEVVPAERNDRWWRSSPPQYDYTWEEKGRRTSTSWTGHQDRTNHKKRNAY